MRRHMADQSAIEWTDSTWNPVTGCTKISAGCKHCYAERMARRLQAMGNPRYQNGFRVTLHDDVLELPYTWRSPRLVFVNSMSDLFHPDVPLPFIRRVFGVMKDCPQHTFQVLTKRSERLREHAHLLPWPPNVWMGVSVEDAAAASRIADLVTVPAAVRFLSCEPLLGPLPQINLTGIQWLIVGGESGPGARPLERTWVVGLLAKARSAGIPFFFKQWGGVQKKRNGRLLDGRIYDESPLTYTPPAASRVAAVK